MSTECGDAGVLDEVVGPVDAGEGAVPVLGDGLEIWGEKGRGAKQE